MNKLILILRLSIQLLGVTAVTLKYATILTTANADGRANKADASSSHRRT